MDRKPDDIIVVKPPHKSQYKSIELNVFNYETTVEDNNGVLHTFKFRLLTPNKVDGKHYFKKNLMHRMEQRAADAPKETKAYYSGTLSMINIFNHCQPGLFRRDKKFVLRAMNKKDPFEELLKLVEKDERGAMDVVDCIEETDWDIKNLMDYALFKNQMLVTSMWDQGYSTFRDIVLGNFEDAKQYIQSMKSDLLDNAREIFETLDEISDSKRAELLAVVKKAKNENPKEMRSVVFDALRRILVDVYLQENDRTQKTSPLGERMYEFITEGVDGVDLSRTPEEVEKKLALKFNEKEFNNIIFEIMKWFEDERKVAPIKLDSIEKAKEIQKTLDELDPNAESVSAYHEYLGCFQALFVRDIIDKYKILAWLAEGFINRMYYMDRLYREAEREYLKVLAAGYRQVYKDIKHIMTREEKRAFKLAHFPQPYFDYRIAIEEPRIVEFAHLDHKNTKDLWILGIVFGIENFGEYDGISKTIESRWRKFLRLYPSWVEIARGVDRDRKREIKHRKMTISTSTLLLRRDEAGNDILLGETLKGPKRFEPDRIISRLLREPQNEELQRWVADYCTPAQRKTIETMFFKGFFLGVEKTATLLGLGEKTVYDHVKDGRDRIVSSLITDALFPENKFPKKRPRLNLK